MRGRRTCDRLSSWCLLLLLLLRRLQRRKDLEVGDVLAWYDGHQTILPLHVQAAARRINAADCALDAVAALQLHV